LNVAKVPEPPAATAISPTAASNMRYRLVFFDMVSRSFVDVSRSGAQFVMEASEAGARVVAARAIRRRASIP
jgi:hypothetical protein